MSKIAYVCACPGEVDYDALVSCSLAGMDFHLYALDDGWFFSKSPGINSNNFSLISNDDIKNIYAELIILRFPQEVWSLPSNKKTICWLSEQGATKTQAFDSSKRYERVAINNKLEMAEYKNAYPNKQVFYLPFCGRQDVYRSNKNYLSDVVSTTTPHYMCGCCDGLKRQSFEVMVRPLLDMNIHCYGMALSEHGWQCIPDLNSKFSGWFEHWRYGDILSSSKIYVDTTFNWKDGGFGCKLARALATGTPVVWHQTRGAELDIPESVLRWSDCAIKTREIVDYLLSNDKEREELGNAGYEWFTKNLVWSDNIKRILDEFG